MSDPEQPGMSIVKIVDNRSKVCFRCHTLCCLNSHLRTAPGGNFYYVAIRLERRDGIFDYCCPACLTDDERLQYAYLMAMEE